MAKRSNRRTSSEDKKRKYMMWGMAVFMGFILTTSLIVLAFQLNPASGSNSIIYGDTSFRIDQRQGLYTFQLDGVEHRTTRLPQEVEYLEVPDAFVSDATSASRIVVTRSELPDEALATASFFLVESLSKSNRYAVSQGYTDREPIVDCSSATDQNVVVLFTQSNDTTLTYEDRCLTASYATQLGVLDTKNAIMYRLLGVTS